MGISFSCLLSCCREEVNEGFLFIPLLFFLLLLAVGLLWRITEGEGGVRSITTAGVFSMGFLQRLQAVPSVLTAPKQHSAAERRSAYLYVGVCVTALIATALCWVHFVGAWVALVALQVAQVMLSITWALTINDLTERVTTPMRCEAVANPLVDAYVALRAVQLMLSLATRHYTCLAFFFIAFGVAVMGLWKSYVYVDAVDVWHNAKKTETNSFIVLTMEILVAVAVLLSMIFSFLNRFS